VYAQRNSQAHQGLCAAPHVEPEQLKRKGRPKAAPNIPPNGQRLMRVLGQRQAE